MADGRWQKWAEAGVGAGGRLLWVVLLVTAAGCARTDRASPAVAMAAAPGGSAAIATNGAFKVAAVMIGAGDIAGCDQRNDEATAAIVDSVLAADSTAHIEDAVFTLGDNAYESGSADDFASCFGASWGNPAKRIMKKIHPAAGNHDHRTPSADAYFKYFGDRAGKPGEGYYSYDVGSWHVAVLNSEIIVNNRFSDGERDAQEAWLARDLKDHATTCTIAYWHHPRFSSGLHGSDARLGRVWQLLYASGVDLVLNGHDHDYERFVPQTPAGIAGTPKGITEIVVGTGGEDLRYFGSRAERNSAARVQGQAGVLLITLGAREWRSVFLGIGGQQLDASGGRCH
jgi:alkaline phosphatase